MKECERISCKTKFVNKTGHQKYCCKKCTTKATHDKHKVFKKKVCKICETEFETSDNKTAMCSSECRKENKRLKSLEHNRIYQQKLREKREKKFCKCGEEISPRAKLCKDCRKTTFIPPKPRKAKIEPVKLIIKDDKMAKRQLTEKHLTIEEKTKAANQKFEKMLPDKETRDRMVAEFKAKHGIRDNF